MPKKLGPYLLENLLGRGGMGAVYAAVHEETGEPAAVKVLAESIGDDERFRSRFLAEVESLQKLRHPNIVSLYGWGEEDGQLFYAMERVDGRSLQDEMQAGRIFHWQEVVRIGIEVCGALKHAHDSGIIHRDLKPANLLMTPQGTIKLTDFGIAKLFGASQLTSEGSVIGTADYMSPEQAEGKGVTHRTDLYSLGAVLFTLLARRTPFARPSLLQVIHSLRYDEAPRLRQFAPNIPEELEIIVDELLRKNPAERIPTARVVANRLQAMWHALGGATRAEPLASPDSTAAGTDAPLTTASPPTSGDRGPTVRDLRDDDSYELSLSGEAPTSLDMSRSSDRWSQAATAASEQTGLSAPRSGPSTGPGDLTVGDPSRATSASPATRPAVTTAPAKRTATHFTKVDRAARRPSEQTVADGDSSTERWKLIAGIATLVALVGVVVAAWFHQNSPNTIYGQIEAAVAADQAEDAKGLMDEFLERFPHDARVATVQDWQRDVECGWLKSRLVIRNFKSGGADLQPFERLYLEAMNARQNQQDGAVAKMQELVEAYGATPEAEPYRNAAQHLLRRWQAGAQPATTSAPQPTDTPQPTEAPPPSNSSS